MHFLGLDIGTTSVKAAVYDETGKRLAQKSADYLLDTDAKTGFIEFPAERYVEICRGLIDAFLSEMPIDAMAFDTQGETLILADEAGNALSPAVVWLDNRATEEADELEAEFGREEVYCVTGQAEISAGWPASKLLWFRKNRPDLFGKTKKIFLLEDFLIYHLTGAFVTEGSLQSSTIYFDIRSGTWWGRMLEAIGVSESQLPKLLPSGTPVGTYRGITVTTGALDQIAGAIGVGAITPETVSEMTGTIMVVSAPTETIPPFREESRIPCHYHAIPGMYVRLFCSSTAGMALKWFRNSFAETFSFRELDELAEGVAPGCDGLVFLPYLCGSAMPVYRPEATGTFTGITLAHTRAHFARAILESIAFSLREDLAYIGDSCKVIRITGGGASGDLWPQIKADVTGKELVKLEESESACLGSAILAMVGSGVYPSVPDAVKATVRTGKTYSPGKEDYEAAYRRYEEVNRNYFSESQRE